MLQKKYQTEKRAAAFYDNQLINYLNPAMQEFISQQEMVFISTADQNGNCDSSFKAGLPGFVRVKDEKTIFYPEYRGNGVMASLGNIVENPHIGLLFIDFLHNQIGLHINGRARIIENDALTDLHLPDSVMNIIKEEEGEKPERWVVIDIDEAYIHCSKHIPAFKKVNKEIFWNTDDAKKKGGDFFKVKKLKKKAESVR
ncbi:pyridoxamine 5'-phosphate oxidase family protein [Heyndrickxia acidicola]|uniref:Pyridoxamine 5'-phosphate oxidase family protein n=1 Tax=Heyndrickxia acidicola TaxID=209389 RepID=A0ABU6MDV1_9BACI|nr:pyridoxamine 5'-phosphate oxidase family protein [Heyndrickxia acidicola]MED1202608.1 pyridoxamine 5'-phosphate oxidase family protein [Heyndrickxia acidicola]